MGFLLLTCFVREIQPPFCAIKPSWQHWPASQQVEDLSVKTRRPACYKGSVESRARRGRPPGQFQAKKDLLYSFILERGQCQMSDAELGQMIGVSPRQVQKYLKALRADGLLSIDIQRYRLGGSSWKNTRTATGEQ